MLRPALAATAVLAVLNHAAIPWVPSRGLSRLGTFSEADTALEGASLLALGMRRLAADLGVIRLIIYYGTPESRGDDGHDHGDGHGTRDHAAFDPEHPERHYGGGKYPLMAAKAKSILDMDPAFKYPVLFAAGSLIFNLNRPDEAFDLLTYALETDPTDLKYRSYLAAIGLHRKGDVEGVIRQLEPSLSQPDCPTMIKSMMAFIYRKNGYKEKAIKLYLDIYENSRDAGYRMIARSKLKELGRSVDP